MTDDPFVTMLQGAMSTLSNQSARLQGIATLGDMRKAMRTVPADTLVVIDKSYKGGPKMASPTEICSYRGYYERLGISTEPGFSWNHEKNESETVLYTETQLVGEAGHNDQYDYDYGCDEVQIAQPCTAGEMLKALDLCDGATFEGYKGGAFTMDEYTYMHAAPSGSSGRMVKGFKMDDEGRLVIVTKKEKY